MKDRDPLKRRCTDRFESDGIVIRFTADSYAHLLPPMGDAGVSVIVKIDDRKLHVHFDQRGKLDSAFVEKPEG